VDPPDVVLYVFRAFAGHKHLLISRNDGDILLRIPNLRDAELNSFILKSSGALTAMSPATVPVGGIGGIPLVNHHYMPVAVLGG
jgi:hypothetical protein